MLSLLISSCVYSQDLTWTGAAGNNIFFDENNWAEVGTGNIPPAGTIDPNVPINRNLTINKVATVIVGVPGTSYDLLMGIGNLTVRKATLKVSSGHSINMGSTTNSLVVDSAVVYCDNVKNTAMTLSGNSKLYLTGGTVTDSISTINATSYDAWMFLPVIDAGVFQSNIATYGSRMKVMGSALTTVNSRIVQYYDGTAISPYTLFYTPLRIYDGDNLTGSSADVMSNRIYSGSSIPGSLNDRISSFRLKKGYMVCLANQSDGTGYSQVYIASESDLLVNTLPARLRDSISFIRVIPYKWVNKKGNAGLIRGVNASWFYDWGSKTLSDNNCEYVPMIWGKVSADNQATTANFLISKPGNTEVLSFNEPDDCNGQSGQWGGLCIIDTAVVNQKFFMKTGLRIVSPACREGAELGWLKNMNALAVPRQIRMDVIAMHWYDWGSNPANSPNAKASDIFNRFKNAVTACYNYYKMPIWITEFNANGYRSRAIQDEFLKLALPWLESTWFVERYAFFSWGTAEFYDANGALTSTGQIYLNQKSTPSIAEQNMNALGNNLQNVINVPTAVQEVVANEPEMSVYYEPKGRNLLVNCAETKMVRLINLFGVEVTNFASNQSIHLNPLPQGIYLVAVNGYKPEKILLK